MPPQEPAREKRGGPEQQRRVGAGEGAEAPQHPRGAAEQAEAEQAEAGAWRPGTPGSEPAVKRDAKRPP